MSEYRDGVFSVSSPAPRYGSLETAFENGSLGGLDEDAAAALDPVLDDFIVKMAVSVSPVGGGGVGGAKGLSGAAAVNIAKEARKLAPEAIQRKLALAIAAGYAASFFGYPDNALMPTVAGICNTFAMTGNQRNALHQEAMSAYKFYLRRQQQLEARDREFLEKKGVPMSGVFRDGVLGSAYQDGVLGDAYHDGVLGALTPIERMLAAKRRIASAPTAAPKCWAVNKFGDKVPVACPRPQRAVRDGSLGALQSNQLVATSPFSSYKALPSHLFVAPERRKKQRRATSGLGCGCAGVGDDAAAAAPVESPFYVKPLFIGAAAVAVGAAIYALTR